jgi:outer membrane immunogenic protein
MRGAISSICRSALFLGLAISSASAADLPARMPVKAPVVVPVAVYNWSGFYIGAHVGGVWGKKDWTDTTVNPPADVGSHNVSGLIAGGQVGFNWQSGDWVYGIEAQASWSNADGRHEFGNAFFTTEVKWLGTIAGRLGYARDRWLWYVKGGAAFAHDEHAIGSTVQIVQGAIVVNPGQVLFEGDKTRWGWMVGAGVEYGIASNWSAKLEYNYMDFGDKTISFAALPPLPPATITAKIDQHLHVVKFGINYRFGAPALVARY